MWREYFVFAWGRNVLQRAVSQYRYLAQFVAPDCVPDWDRYCSDPYLMVRTAHQGEMSSDAATAACLGLWYRHPVQPLLEGVGREEGGLAHLHTY